MTIFFVLVAQKILITCSNVSHLIPIILLKSIDRAAALSGAREIG
jgi:hypothetical protein